jgi:hyperosmotically inducible protein
MKKRISMVLALSALVVFSLAGAGLAADESATKADNSKMNKELRDKKETTADQQAENPADRKITQKIRRAVVKNKSLSVYAHNVKIITRNGAVSLKGPVRSEKEKEFIEKAAEKVAGKDHVSSELLVEPKEKK